MFPYDGADSDEYGMVHVESFGPRTYRCWTVVWNEGTPKKRSRTKISSFSITSRLSLVPPLGESVNKTEMGGAAMAAPRKMMREEAKLAEDDMEQTGGEVGPIPGASRETSM